MIPLFRISSIFPLSTIKLCTRYVDLYPIFDSETGDLLDLLFANDKKEYKPEELVRLISPFYSEPTSDFLYLT